ncbi:hypothetical protein VNO78_22642 [Psophocarpus tetragonolobus]|uniref:Uncharacterized protein n=1 Tax=Psophocarpus tetragonolobus TaxID=3891 RepID=A0AAN9S2P3_PSOTE
MRGVGSEVRWRGGTVVAGDEGRQQWWERGRLVLEITEKGLLRTQVAPPLKHLPNAAPNFAALSCVWVEDGPPMANSDETSNQMASLTDNNGTNDCTTHARNVLPETMHHASANSTSLVQPVAWHAKSTFTKMKSKLKRKPKIVSNATNAMGPLMHKTPAIYNTKAMTNANIEDVDYTVGRKVPRYVAKGHDTPKVHGHKLVDVVK